MIGTVLTAAVRLAHQPEATSAQRREPTSITTTMLPHIITTTTTRALTSNLALSAPSAFLLTLSPTATRNLPTHHLIIITTDMQQATLIRLHRTSIITITSHELHLHLANLASPFIILAFWTLSLTSLAKTSDRKSTKQFSPQHPRLPPLSTLRLNSAAR